MDRLAKPTLLELRLLDRLDKTADCWRLETGCWTGQLSNTVGLNVAGLAKLSRILRPPTRPVSEGLVEA